MIRRHRETGRTELGSAAGRRARASVLSLTTAALTTVIFAVPGATPAQAAPTAVTIAEAKAQIEQLETEASAIDQEYVGVKEQLDAGRVSLALKQADVREQVTKVATIKRQVGQVALAQFQNRNLDTAAQIFFNSDSDNFLSQVSTVEKVSENQNTVLQDFQEQQARLAELELSTQTGLAALTEQQKQLATLRTESDGKIAESKRVLARLTAAEQAALAAAEKQAAAEAKAKAERAAAAAAAAAAAKPRTKPGTPGTTADKPAGTSTDKNPSPAAVTGSSRGATALAFARKQLGKPYRFAAAGPGAYDCSGLTSAAWRAAGVTITRTSQSQIHDGRPVSKSQLQPGDLVFYYSASAPTHVAMYVGGGTIIHAPHSGAVVRYAPLSSMPFTGAVRPG